MRAIVFSGGEPARPGLPLPARDLVVCADSGLASADALDVQPDVIVGDLDSIDPVALERARRTGVEVEAHPAAKDATDLELALDAALRRGAASIVVVSGGPGPRLDHFVAELALLAATPAVAEALVGSARIRFVRAPASVAVTGTPGEVVSLVPAGADVGGVTTSGLRWPLTAEPLPFGTTRGVSNELSGTHATVSVTSGVLLVVQP